MNKIFIFFIAFFLLGGAKDKTASKKEIINSLDLKNSFKMNKIAIVNTGQNVSEWEVILEKKINA